MALLNIHEEIMQEPPQMWREGKERRKKEGMGGSIDRDEQITGKKGE